MYGTVKCHSLVSCITENKKMAQDGYGKAYKEARCVAWLILSLGTR
jgi:hypothetical protein